LVVLLHGNGAIAQRKSRKREREIEKKTCLATFEREKHRNCSSVKQLYTKPVLHFVIMPLKGIIISLETNLNPLRLNKIERERELRNYNIVI